MESAVRVSVGTLVGAWVLSTLVGVKVGAGVGEVGTGVGACVPTSIVGVSVGPGVGAVVGSAEGICAHVLFIASVYTTVMYGAYLRSPQSLQV